MDNNIKKETLEELEIDYNNNAENFINSLDERIELAKYLNNKYSYKFNPINMDYLYEQKNILLDHIFKLDKNKENNFMNSINIENNEENLNEYDPVNKPYHYVSGKFECLDVMRDVFGDERVKTWCVLNAFKYLFRCYKKNGDEDIAKANFYLNYIIEKIN